MGDTQVSQPRGLQRGEDGVESDRIGCLVEGDERHSTQVARREHRLVCQRMIEWQCDADGFSRDHCGTDAGLVHFASDEDEVETQVVERFLRRASGRQRAHNRVDVGRVLREPREELRNERGGQRRHRANADLARFAAPQAGHRQECGIEALENASSLIEEHVARTGKRDATVRAIEQDQTQLLLDRPDRLAHRGLSDVEAGRRPSEVELFGDSHEAAQLPDLHTRMISHAS